VGYSPDSNDVSTEAEESPLLGDVVRERLVRTQGAGKGLSGAVLICKVCTSAIAF
jgi:hypothetical protein